MADVTANRRKGRKRKRRGERRGRKRNFHILLMREEIDLITLENSLSLSNKV